MKHSSSSLESIVQINDLDDLKKIIFLQKTITTQAQNELLAAANDTAVEEHEDVESQALRFMKEEMKVLDKYAKYPTLTEYQMMPNSYDGFKWGATFGVTLLVGELIFEQLKLAHPHFSPVVRQLYVIFLSELDNPKHEYLIEPMEKLLRYKITSDAGDTISPEKQKEHVRKLVSQLADTMVAISVPYGVVGVKKGGVVITPLGKRILLHLVDAARFVSDMTLAHAKFQKGKPQFSMA